MAWSFNPFTGNLDLVGGGAVVFEGEVETFADLPETVGDPAVGASFLVRSSTGVWLVNRRQAGIWIRKNNTGVRATDWEYGGDYPVNSVNGQSGNVVLGASDVGAAAATHTHAASAITSGVFDNARINFAAPSSIGSTTANSGAFTTLNATNGTITASAPVLDLSQTWNNAAVTFTGLRFNVTNTASASASLIADLQVGGTSQFSVRRDGRVNCNSITVGGASTMDTGAGQLLIRNAVLGWDSNAVMIQNTDLQLFRDAADTLAQRRSTNAQTFRIYNTFTDASNYERGYIRWNTNVLQIGTEAAGTGVVRQVQFPLGTVTASTPLEITQTWNNGAVAFIPFRVSVTNTASSSDSVLALFSVGGATQFAIGRGGEAQATFYRFVNLNAGMGVHSTGGTGHLTWGSPTTSFFSATDTIFRVSGSISIGRSVTAGQTADTFLFRDDAGTLAQRNAANAQTFRIYNTFTDASNYERGFMRWSSNVLQIGTEKGGTGSARALEFQTDGLTRLIISAGGSVVHGLSNGVIGWTSSTILRPVSGNGTLVLYNNAQTDFNRLQFGGTDATFPALKRSSTTLQVRLADDSAFAPFECAGLTLNGNLTASTRDIVTDTTTGTKIGTGTTQKIGFFNATPVVQQAAVADATDAASTQARLNDLLARLRTLGLIAT